MIELATPADELAAENARGDHGDPARSTSCAKTHGSTPRTTNCDGMFADPRDSYTILASGMPGKPGGPGDPGGPGGDVEPEEGDEEEEDDEA